MKIEWTNDLATGIELIDEQHKELFRRINALLEACMKGEGAQAAIQTLDYLGWYVIEHFETEEEVMRRAKYAATREHEAMHRQFRNTIADLRMELESSGIGPHIVVRVNRLVIDWLNTHIRKADKVMAADLRQDFTTPAPPR